MAHILGQAGTQAKSSNVAMDPMNPTNASQNADNWHRTRKLVLCFDGTGNKFHGDESDSNILKIFRMLDSSSDDQYQYYQRKLTYGGGGGLALEPMWSQRTSPTQAFGRGLALGTIGSSFDQHVVGGYRFLMRYYSPGDEIYMFGFSRGAYVARFLAEMLDYVGLLAHGNEEMVIFAWNAFSQWQCRRANSTPEGKEDKEKMYKFLKGFRETFSRPIRRIRFLGLFDCVNSVPRFETAWMQRDKFPYTARSSAKVIRHAVSIDERRAKFRQDLIYQEKKKCKKSKKDALGHSLMEKNPLNDKLHGFQEKYRPGKRVALDPNDIPGSAGRGRGAPNELLPDDADHPVRYRNRSRSRSRATSRGMSDNTSLASRAPVPDAGYDSDDDEQDIDEVWFAGGHADIGGGWDVIPGQKSSSHVPLVWMVREAMRAGLSLDVRQLEEIGCIECADDHEEECEAAHMDIPEIHIDAPSPGVSSPDVLEQDVQDKPAQPGDARFKFEEMLRDAHLSDLHDSLRFGRGVPRLSVCGWRFMEWMPFRRLDLRPDGSWKPIRWPLPRGEVRDIPENVRVHGSVIRRLEMDPTYRPGNLIIGGGGRGVRTASEKHGIGEWICVKGKGDPVEEIWVRKKKSDTGES
ncbi:hypothetical protein HYQ45_009116 [Verticillium longisporum]|uniref:T6SS Phospholipase effector Tle1-like catalytic domain-containing protein n=1 Tax=Verticillium longisporum TaxID=100787 RepID=A0A8I3AQL3_VERLO|nr:hypothetical protein HYQ45_009116 [Verticillium longisporum]